MITIITIITLINMSVLLIKAFSGETVCDRILAVNGFGTNAIVMIGVLVVIVGEPMFLDIALIYVLINFITTTAFLKYFRDVSSKENK